MGILALDKKRNKHVLFIKGASEILLNKAGQFMTSSGKTVKFNDNDRASVNEQLLENLQKLSLRTLAICIKEDLPELNGFNMNHEDLKAYFKDMKNFALIENNCTLLGFVGMLDPPRVEVKEAIETCKNAGIRVIMITGDNKVTADSVGKEIGILDEGNVKSQSWSATEFFKLDEDEQIKLLKEQPSLIFSRTAPKHKMDLVTLLKNKCGYIVAMTGDGVNDAPALAEANIGIAMGRTGTEVAKEAADMILADDNFASIVKAIGEGRSIYMNMKAFIRYLISSNIGEVVSIFLTSLFGIPEAFTSIQLLWVNLVTDGPPATALGFNPKEKNIMDKPPRSNDDALLTRWVILRYFVIGFYVGAATVGIFVYWYLYFHHPDNHSLITWEQLTNWMKCENWTDFSVNSFDGIDLSKNPCAYFTTGKKKAVTLSLTVLVIIEMFNAMNAVSDEQSVLVVPPYKNVWLLIAITFSCSLHCVILYIPFFAKIFGLAPLDCSEWMLVFYFSIPVILIEEVMKFISRMTSSSDTRHMLKQKKLR
jgi:Ca2+-transporting ATPase